MVFVFLSLFNFLYQNCNIIDQFLYYSSAFKFFQFQNCLMNLLRSLGVLLQFLRKSLQIMKYVISGYNGKSNGCKQNNQRPSVYYVRKSRTLPADKICHKTVRHRKLLFIDQKNNPKASFDIVHHHNLLSWNYKRTLSNLKTLIYCNWICIQYSTVTQVVLMNWMPETLVQINLKRVPVNYLILRRTLLNDFKKNDLGWRVVIQFIKILCHSLLVDLYFN